ncbi:hypothetical protein, partial [Paraburkholderia sp. Cpub6]|uniref:hypothetical protein n=1 Tax=Paraburkholderia sp. Cpub6 TaxID=2723094 RepID=UPI001C8424F5
GCTEPLHDPVRRAAGAGLNLNPFTQNSGHPRTILAIGKLQPDSLFATLRQPSTLICNGDAARFD